MLNAANDRFFNLSLYQAVDATGAPCDETNTAPAPESTGVACTEVALNPDEVAAALQDTTVFPTPVAGTEGPDWIHIGTEGGFVPTPTEIPAQPTTWVNDPTVFNAGNVDQHSLLVAPAERHDVVVDLSAYAGQTLILYNDAPAAFPARDPRYDYYTGNADLRDSGGAPSTLAGYGPNTRTVMQIKVADTAPAPAYDLPALQTAFASVVNGGMGVFEQSQKPIIVGQGAYNSAYGTSFRNTGPFAGLSQIFDTSLTFDRLVDDGDPGAPYATSTPDQRLTISMKPKMIQDEMGEAFEREYGRMSGFLGVETPNAQAGNQNMILSPYTYPPTEIIDGVELPPGVEATPLTSADDGTQIWKFTHNGVDTHPIHFHLYDVQLLNRVGWDGIIRKPDPTELGWKDTVRVSPLEDTIVALRAIIPPIPDGWNGLPNSIRLLDPSMPEGAFLETPVQEAAGLPIFAFNPDGEPVDVVNHFVNFGWEYVLHCHILSHEEMDMMHAQIVGVEPAPPDSPTITGTVGSGAERANVIAWVDTSKNETAFVVERRVAGSQDAWTQVGTVASETLGGLGYTPGTGASTGGAMTFNDVVGETTTVYEYQVYAANTVGDVWDYSDPAINNIPPGGGFPTLTLKSEAVGTPATTVVERIAGANRYATAAALSQSVFPSPVPVAYVASGLNFPDALAGGPAAAVEGGPLLLVGSGIPAETAAELTRLQPAQIVVLGGTGVVSAQVASSLASYTSGDVTRVSGSDRYATAAALSLRAFPNGATTAYVASGLTFPDALSGGAAAAANGAPLLLVGNGAVPTATANELTRLGVTTIKVLGGPAAISEATATALGSYGTVQRISGPDRYATSVAINQDAFADNTGGTVYLATGLNFPDALTVAPTARPLVLVPGTSTTLPAGTAAELQRLNPARAVIMGGTGAVSAELEQAVRTLLGAVVVTP